MDLGLTDKRVVITGGARGIGRAIALAFAREGALICAPGIASEEDKAEMLELFKNAGYASPAILDGDVTDAGFAKEVANYMSENYGGVDVLINNAGITSDGLILRMKPENFEKVININLVGAFYMLKELSALMLKQREGRIVNISSVSGVKGNAGQANYSASKAGLIGLTLSASKELSGKGITVNAIAPGFIDTAMTQALSEEQHANVLKQIGSGRVGTPEEVPDLVCFLCSEKAAYITGQVVAIDGGLIM